LAVGFLLQLACLGSLALQAAAASSLHRHRTFVNLWLSPRHPARSLQAAAASIGADVIRRDGSRQLNNCENVRSLKTRSELNSEHSKGFKIHFKDFCVFKGSNLISCSFN
jgi:hypothetical protein